MITALLLAYFLGGGFSGSGLTSSSVKELSEHTAMVVMDSARAKAAQRVLAQLRKEVKSFEKIFSRSDRQLKKSHQNHEADPDQALAVLEDLNTTWESYQHNTLDLRFQLRETLTREEWAALFAVD